MSYNEFLGIALLVSLFQIGFLFRVIDQVDKLSTTVKELKAERRKMPTAKMLSEEEISTEIPEPRESSIPSPFVEGSGNGWQFQSR